MQLDNLIVSLCNCPAKEKKNHTHLLELVKRFYGHDMLSKIQEFSFMIMTDHACSTKIPSRKMHYQHLNKMDTISSYPN